MTEPADSHGNRPLGGESSILFQRTACPSKGPTLGGVLGVWFSVLAVFCCVGMGLLFYSMDKQRLEQLILSHLDLIRDDKIRTVQDWMDERRNDARVLSRGRSTIDACERYRVQEPGALDEAQRELQHIVAVYGLSAAYLADPNTGRPIIQASRDSTSPPPLPSSMVAQIRRTRTPAVSDILPVGVPERPTVVVAAPVVSRQDRQILAVFVLQTDLREEFYEHFPINRQPGETGETMLIGEDGVIRSPLRHPGEGTGSARVSEELSQHLKERRRGSIHTEDYRNIMVASSYGPIPDTTWNLVVKQDASEAFAPIRQLARRTMWATCIALGCALTGAWFLARRIAKPAQRIAEVARRIGEGRLRSRAPANGPREIRDIAIHLNAMVGRLTRMVRYQEALTSVFATAGSHKRLQPLLKDVADRVMEATRSFLAVFYMPEESEENHLRRVYVRGAPEEWLPERLSLRPATNALAEAAATQEVHQVTGRAPLSSLWSPGATEHPHPRAMLAIPFLRSGKPVGVMGLVSASGYRDEDLYMAKILHVSFGALIDAATAGDNAEYMTEALMAANNELNRMNNELQDRLEQLEMQATLLDAQGKELAAHRQTLQESNRLKSQFLSHMSHELRTPLSSILALSELLLTQGAETPLAQQREFLQVIYRNGQHVLNLINNLLDLTRIEAGQMPLEITECDPCEIVNTVVSLMRPLINEKHLRVQAALTDVGMMQTDENKVRQILLNLISNAVKFTQQGGADLDLYAQGDEIVFHICDTGIGISPEDLPKLFQEFRQVGAGGKSKEGTGLGLAIAQKLCRLLGGEITVRSQPGKGSEFTVTLPRVCPDTPPTPPSKEVAPCPPLSVAAPPLAGASSTEAY